jgi:hypothetical protein
MSDQDAAEDLLREAKNNRRHTTDAPEQSTVDEADDDPVDLPSAIAEAYGEIDAGETPSNLTLRDSNLAALFAGLEQSGQLEPIIDGAYDALDRDGEVDSYTRATALRLLVRVGLDEVDGEVIEAGKEGKQQFLTEQADEF